MSIEVKICGLATEEAIAVAAEGGARYVGLVIYPPSPRNVSVADAARLAASAPAGVAVVALLVDPNDALVAEVARRVRPAMLQLHGAETPERVREIRRLSGLPVMKAIKIAADEDFAAAALYADVADRLLFDAKPPASLAGALPGGNAVTFDWRLLAGRSFALPWMLSGGLDPQNVAEAVRISGATAVDVSSGVETRPGVKDLDKIRAFLRAALRD